MQHPPEYKLRKHTIFDIISVLHNNYFSREKRRSRRFSACYLPILQGFYLQIVIRQRLFYLGASLMGQMANAIRRAAKANKKRSSSVSDLSMTFTTVGSCHCWITEI